MPYTTEPRQIVADAQERFFLDYGEKVIRWTSREDKVFTFNPPQDWGQSIKNYIVKSNSTIFSVIDLNKTECNNKKCDQTTSYYKIILSKCADGISCQQKIVASWSVGSIDAYPISYRHFFSVTPEGTEQLELEKTIPSPTTYRVEKSWCNINTCQTKEFFSQAALKKLTIKCDKFGDDTRGIWTHIAGAISGINTANVCDIQNNGHSFYQEAQGRSLMHSVKGQTLNTQPYMIDSAEAGAEVAATPYQKGVLAAWNFFRTPFYKGVRVGIWDEKSELINSIVIDKSVITNPGWNLRVEASPQGRVIIAYKPDALSHVYLFRLFEDRQDLEAAKQLEPTGWDAYYKPWFIYAGAGVWYSSFNLYADSPSLDKAKDQGHLVSGEYKTEATPFLETWLEANYANYHAGASYVQQALIKQTQGKTKSTLKWFSAFVGLDDIFPYHSFKISARKGFLKNQYTLTSSEYPSKISTSLSKNVDSNYSRFDLAFINTWRIHYGFATQSYKTEMPFYFWTSTDTENKFLASFSTPVNFKDYLFFIGYSRLNYAAKYEAKVFDWFLDSEFIFGLTKTGVSENKVNSELAKLGITNKYSFNSSAQIESAGMFGLKFDLGVIWLAREYAWQGAGYFVRAGARCEYLSTGSEQPDTPKDSDKNTDTTSEAKPPKPTITGGFNRSELQYGPFAHVGFVF